MKSRSLETLYRLGIALALLLAALKHYSLTLHTAVPPSIPESHFTQLPSN